MSYLVKTVDTCSIAIQASTFARVKKSCLEYSYRAAKDLEERRSHYEPSLGPGVPDDVDHIFNLEENDFVPHFQRVSISGEDTSGVR